ncbi:hypothetical protein DSO57_1031232 [Entomophthora muscae]|uniref:Uncharacterized protein n=1 Tax=Entomophthora muscae TaxID=34485 RepID=A0ACC2SDM8_9FUNG|nr:hypothetical protein DSO57_1031232 [Entomophthora muscae]
MAGKALPYLVKLGPIIWWAMPVPALTPPSPAGAPQYSWPPTPKVPVNPTNESAGQAKDPEITWATAAGEAKKLPVECRSPKDDQPCNPKGKFESSQLKPTNEISPAMDATKDCKTLVDSITRPKRNCKSFSMTDGYTYTLGRQEVAHCHSCNKLYFICSLHPAVLYLTPNNPKKPQTNCPNYIVHQELPLAWYILQNTHPTWHIWNSP